MIIQILCNLIRKVIMFIKFMLLVLLFSMPLFAVFTEKWSTTKLFLRKFSPCCLHFLQKLRPKNQNCYIWRHHNTKNQCLLWLSLVLLPCACEIFCKKTFRENSLLELSEINVPATNHDMNDECKWNAHTMKCSRNRHLPDHKNDSIELTLPRKSAERRRSQEIGGT